MTVAELRKALEGVPDEMEVLIEYDGSYKGNSKSATIRNGHFIISEENLATVARIEAAMSSRVS